MKSIIPDKALEGHIAAVGMTGSGKTSTSKLIVEHVVSTGARVCIIDPLKSDWWGLISSADGKRPGLPFHILGGPRGHVPLHPTSGKAIGEIVGNGSLRHSILDMADFEPGEPNRFFIDFAGALFRHARGVVYLVVEEAHEFAPKERAGIGNENMALHWVKRIATAARSKGIRLIVCTQRTQKLHNDLLSSCDTILAHRVRFPADQTPIADWMKARYPEQATEVKGTLATLKTGEAWVCTADDVRRVQFPKIHTFDNSATPTHDAESVDVKTAPVDQDALRAIIGDAVKEAEANDPKALKRRIADLEKQLAAKPAAQADPAAVDRAVAARDVHWRSVVATQKNRLTVAIKAIESVQLYSTNAIENLNTNFAELGAAEIVGTARVNTRDCPPMTPAAGTAIGKMVGEVQQSTGPAGPGLPRRSNATAPAGKGASLDLPRMDRAFLTVLAQHPAGLTKGQILTYTSYASSGPVSTAFARLAQAGYVRAEGGKLYLTCAGEDALGDYEPLPTGRELLKSLLDGDKLSRMEKALLGEVCQRGQGVTVSKSEVLAAAGYASSGPVSSAWARLTRMGYVKVVPGGVTGGEELFD